MLKSIFNFFVFSSLYIALCAVLMIWQVSHIFLGDAITVPFYAFVFFSTICSYNFHWYLTVHSATGSERLQWAVRNKSVHLILYLIGLAGSAYYLFLLRQHWYWILLGAFVTFLYSAPKIPHPLFSQLKRIAIGKTIFLAFVWTYVTSMLPLLISGERWLASCTWFVCSRFFLIYAICILFDYRDREDDKSDGIRSMITYFNEKGINVLFGISITAFVAFTLLLFYNGTPVWATVLLLVPGIIVTLLYPYAKRHFSDYLYYFVLDGLMMLSSLLMLVLGI